MYIVVRKFQIHSLVQEDEGTCLNVFFNPPFTIQAMSTTWRFHKVLKKPKNFHFGKLRECSKLFVDKKISNDAEKKSDLNSTVKIIFETQFKIQHATGNLRLGLIEHSGKRSNRKGRC